MYLVKLLQNKGHFLVIFTILYLMPADATEIHLSVITCVYLSFVEL